MADEYSSSGEGRRDNAADRNFPNPSDMLGLMVSMQRLGTQVMWQMGEAMADMMAMPLRRDGDPESKSAPVKRCVSDIKDAVDGATEILQQGGRPR